MSYVVDVKETALSLLFGISSPYAVIMFGLSSERTLFFSFQNAILIVGVLYWFFRLKYNFHPLSLDHLDFVY
jgi:hypothetical protein